MKKTLLLLVLITFTLATNAQSDLTRYGLKGKIDQVSYSMNGNLLYTNKFDANGNFMEYNFELNFYGISATIKSRTKNGMSGVYSMQGESDNFTVTFANNRLTKMVIKDSKGTMTMTYTYSNGNLSRVDESYVYYKEESIEYGANLTGVDNYYNEVQRASEDYYRDIESQAEAISRNPLAALNAQRNIEQSANRATNRITNAASGVGINYHARTKKVRHEDKHYIIYKNYVFDEFGNWSSRQCSRDDNGSATQYQLVSYDKDYYGNYFWEKYQASGDLLKMEQLALDTKSSDKYRLLAKDYWNERILKEVATAYKNDLDSLCRIANSKIITDSNKNTALNIVRNAEYNNVVLPLRDFRLIAQKKDIRRMNMPVFDEIFKNRIDSLSNAYLNDSIIFLTQKAQRNLDDSQPEEACATANLLKRIDPDNTFAQNMLHEAGYQMLVKKQANMTIHEEDYKQYIELYPNSNHIQEAKNNRALLASSLFNKETTENEFQRVLNLPTDEPTAKIVNKRYKKQYFKNNRDRFFHIGLDGEFAIGATNTVAGGGLLFRLGYTANILNFVTGIKYNYLTPTSSMFQTPKEDNKAFFENQYLSVPAILQINIIPGYTGCTYIGLGAELNVNNLSTQLRTNGDAIKEKDFANTSCIIPRFSFGGRLLGMELELFATYDTKNPFNVDYVNAYKIDDNPVESKCDPDIFEKQIKKDGFFDKVRGGLSFKFWF